MFRHLLMAVLLFLSCTQQAAAQTGYDTIRILFPVNVTRPDLQAKRLLDSLGNSLRGRQLLVYGYADYLGNTPANMQLAEGRAHHVAEALKHAGIREQDLLVVAGIGEVKRAEKNGKDGYPEDRCAVIFARRLYAVQPAAAAQHIPQKERNGSADPAKKSAAQPKMITAELGDIAHMQVGQSFPIRHLNFVYGEWILTKDSKPALDELCKAMKANPGLEIQLEGHVCCASAESVQQHKDVDEHKLAAHRAHSIYQYLVERGIDGKRMKHIGYGSTRPLISPERSEADAAVNRRVEVRITKNDQADTTCR